MLDKNSSIRHFEIFFVTFPRKQDLRFDANCPLDTLNVKSCFLGKIRKTHISKCRLLKILPRDLSVKNSTYNLLARTSSNVENV